MAVRVDFEHTTYSDIRGNEYHAIQLSWDQVQEILGKGYADGPIDENRLIQALLDSGAPQWVRDAEGWIDEYGWGLIGPAVSS